MVSHVIAALIDLDDFVVSCQRNGESWGNARRRAVGDMIDRLVTLDPAARCCAVLPDEWLVLFDGDDPPDLIERALVLARAVRDTARSHHSGGVSVGVSRPFGGPGAELAAERDARALIGYKLLCGGEQVFFERPAAATERRVPSRALRLLADAARTSHPEDIVRVLLDCTDGLAPADLPAVVGGLLLTVADNAGPLRADGGTDWMMLGPGLARLRLDALAAVHERSYLRVWLDRAVGQLVAESNSRPMGPVERAEAYLRSHYADPGLALAVVARAVRVSPYYLAHLFNSERDSTFRRELTGIRMRAARRLLSDRELPIQRVAEQVGFTGHKAFRAAFKREVGCTPSEYRLRCTARAPQQAL